ncbi:flavin monoamine oxidase family protein, partial [Archangium sp.]|uniref:flavin monoamine oxidase family protein n=1 Tax=Archangium sp. TaxID=1872627 RepID=UPI002D6208C9
MKSRGNAHSRNGDIDVAIVGAGASGLYAAWRLARETKLRVQLFELDAMRVGGRMYTTIPENMPTMRAELGAMRFSPTQELLAGLIQELGLATMPFSGNELLGVYLRARRLPGEACAARTYAHVPSSAPLPYNLRDDEKGKSAPELLVNAMFQAVPGAAADIPPRQLFDLLSKAEVPAEGGRPLHESGFWNLLMRSLSDEAYQFVFDSFGIESALSNWNSMAALFTFKLLLPALQGGDKQFRTLADGFSQLAHELKRGFEDEGGEVLLGHRLLACARSYRGDGPGVELTFQNEATGERSVLHAHQAILAMPARALELLDS